MFFDALGAMLSLDPAAIMALQTSPAGLRTALAILLVATISDALGNSPILFLKQMPPGRLVAVLAIEVLLSVIRLSLWIMSFWVLVYALNPGAVELTSVFLVVGLGYAPMVLSFLVIIPTFGPLVGRLLIAWTLVTMTASIAVAANSSPWTALTAPIIALLALLVVRRFSDRVSVALLGGFSRRLVGVDLMQRNRALDPRRVMTAHHEGLRNG